MWRAVRAGSCAPRAAPARVRPNRVSASRLLRPRRPRRSAMRPTAKAAARAEVVCPATPTQRVESAAEPVGYARTWRPATAPASSRRPRCFAIRATARGAARATSAPSAASTASAASAARSVRIVRRALCRARPISASSHRSRATARTARAAAMSTTPASRASSIRGAVRAARRARTAPRLAASATPAPLRGRAPMCRPSARRPTDHAAVASPRLRLR